MMTGDPRRQWKTGRRKVISKKGSEIRNQEVDENKWEKPKQESFEIHYGR